MFFLYFCRYYSKISSNERHSKYQEEKMHKTLKILALGILIFWGTSLCALAVDVSGTWDMTIQSERGDWNTELTIEQDGEKIKVTMPGFQGDKLEAEGTVTDNKIEFTFNISTQQGDFSITYKGTVEDNTMSGEADVGDFGTMKWTAKKK
jgi:hypothetical protein